MSSSYISKTDLMSVTENGWLYFSKLFPELEKPANKGQNCKNIINRFRDEENPSLRIYCKNGVWKAIDFADPDYNGDMFKFYAAVEGLNEVKGNFIQIMNGIYKEVTGKEPPLLKGTAPKFETAELPEGVDYLIEDIPFESLGKDEKNFLAKYHIDPEVMKSNSSYFIQSQTFRRDNGEALRLNKKPKEVMIAHKVAESAKIYQPYKKEFKFTWRGGMPKEYVYGIHLLKKSFKDIQDGEHKNQPLSLVCCAGEKDALVLQSMGYKAFCLSSETNTYFPETLLCYILDFHDALNDKFELVILYDKDETGKKCAEKIVEYQSKHEYNIRIVELPDTLVQKGGKDVSDFISLGFPKEDLIELIGAKPFSPESSVSPQEDNLDPVEEEESTDSSPVMDNEDALQISYETLPTFLGECLVPFDGEIKLMMLLSFLTTIGSTMHKVIGRFRDDYIYPNLFTIIIAPPASGKSQIKWARNLILPIDEFLIENSKQAISQFREQQELVKNGDMDSSELGPEPAYEVKLIPCDITSAAWIKQMSDNNGYGLMYDTEIDGLVQSNSGNLRSFSDYLRKSYEGEPLSVMRKKDREHIRVEKGKLSLLISGTPQQFYRLIPDGENGLFSRVIPFRFNGLDRWLSVFKDEEFDFTKHFETLSEQILEYFLNLESLPEPVTFLFSDSQKIKLDQVFEKRIEWIKTIAGFDGRATVNRLGAITFKIAMILTTLRRLETDSMHNSFQCTPEDFNSAMAISELILNNAIDVLRQMNEERAENLFRGIKLDYYYALPSQFTFAESQQIAEDMCIKPKTAEKWIYLLRDKAFLVNPKKGHFKKVG
ncbi:DUF3987 domain-containing protein [Flagellimonas eckloniae]|uniref:Toprim domain-containing protein n=1 Tax=Flagellimonas eckloniae TaxID=346185 RepID=A0A0Q1BI39_9FLAO|nr:DUF3987 domain-containing protein [Allomuricauda eckloniae]KQC30221.1 hypothetical protein AAY42_10290 [Allomuricauda eckloniae]